MYGDTDVLRRRVDELREQAVDVRALADRLVAQTESIGWTGRAAESMRLRVTERATHLRGAAAQHESAADVLDHHLQEVERAADEIAAIEQRVEALVADARTRVARIAATAEASYDDKAPGEPRVRIEADPDDLALTRFEAPPSGHRDWLDVELPGL